jgi:hypothetical protein
MAEVSERIFLGEYEVFGFYDNKWIGINSYSEAGVAPGPTYTVRYDPFSGSLVTAQPFSIFSELGMNSVSESIDGLIRTGDIADSYMLRATGSSAAYLYTSASVVDSGSGAYDWSAEDYTSSISQENSQNTGIVRTADYNIGSNDFVVEFWFNPRSNFGNPPYHMWCFGSDAGGDYVLIQWSNSSPDSFRFYINGNQTWTTTPVADQGSSIVNGNWYHVAFVKSSTNVYVYLNGNRIGVGTRPATVNTPPSGLYQLGGINSGNNNDGIRKNIQDYRFYMGTDKGYRFSTIPVPESIIALSQTTGIVSGGLQMYVDAGNAASYPGSGTTWSDLSGNGNDATLVNSPTHTSGDSGYFQLNGSNQYVRLPIPLNQSGNTFMIIAKSTAGSKAHKTMMTTVLTGGTSSSSPYRDLTWDTTTCGTYSYITSPGVADIATSYNLNQWYSFVISEADCIQNGYFDGTETITDRVLDSAGSGENQQMVVGTGYWGYANMQVAAVLVYNRQLSDEEIQQNLDIFNARY